MTVIAHFVGGPRDGELQMLDDTSVRTLLIAHDDGVGWNYDLQVLVVADEKIWVFVVEGLSPDQALITYLENCRVRH